MRCSTSGSAGLALRAGLGGEVLLGSGLWFVLDAVLDNVHLLSGPLDECIGGAGTVSLFGARAGFAYRFDDVRSYMR